LHLISTYTDEYASLPSYSHNKKEQFGLGFTELDAMLLYFMIRELKPKRVIEVGSGLSTLYCSMATAKNSQLNHPSEISCIYHFAYEKLKALSNVRVMSKEVQDVDLAFFDRLGDGDVLLVDSTHMVRIDGDVPYLYLEVIPRLKRGCYVHVHDVHFPYNVPLPSE